MFGVDEEEIAVEPASPTGVAEGAWIPHLDEIVERLERPERRFPLERAILISLLLHIILYLIFQFGPSGAPRERVTQVARRDEVPVYFYPPPGSRRFVESPGPARENPKKESPLSDKTRRAGGGDKSKSRSETPFVPPASGIQGLAPGPRTRPSAPSAASPPARTTASASQAPSPKGILASETQSPNPLTEPKGRPNGSEGPRVPDLNQAIRQATGNPFAGEGGAPRANPSGGFVDSGPVSFDTQWYDWGDYAEEMIRRIKLHWEVPELARVGVRGRLTIRFYIRADGTVEDERILRSSNIPPFDHSAFRAISTSDPFRPLPKDLHEDREGVTVTFFYNISPGEER
jgi:protein TonB